MTSEKMFRRSTEQNIIGELLEQKTQGKKFDNGKAPITLIPSETLLGIAQVFGFGASKYGRHNFREGLAHSRCLDAAMRHLLAIVGGEDLDPESGMPHIYHAMCSLAMYDWQRLHHPELNDRYNKNEEKKS